MFSKEAPRVQFPLRVCMLGQSVYRKKAPPPTPPPSPLHSHKESCGRDDHRSIVCLWFLFFLHSITFHTCAISITSGRFGSKSSTLHLTWTGRTETLKRATSMSYFVLMYHDLFVVKPLFIRWMSEILRKKNIQKRRGKKKNRGGGDFPTLVTV